MEERIKKCHDMLIKVFSETETNNIINHLRNLRYFTAPASTKYHGAYEGGLFDHSYAVTKNLLKLTEKMGLVWQNPESPYIIGLFHDLCKCDCYIKNDDGTYKFNTDAPKGHGDKSVDIASNIRPLSEEERLCIRWHMGAFDDKDNWNAYTIAIDSYNNVLWTHTADMMASRFDKI